MFILKKRIAPIKTFVTYQFLLSKIQNFLSCPIVATIAKENRQNWRLTNVYFCGSRPLSPACWNNSAWGSTHTRPVRMCQRWSAVYSVAADLSTPRVSTTAEAHPARSPCAFGDDVPLPSHCSQEPLLRHIRPGLRVRHRIQEPGPEGPVPVTRIYGGFREVGTGPGKYDKIWGTVHDAARTPVFSEIDRRQELYSGEDLPNQGKYEIVLGMFLFICCFFSLIGVWYIASSDSLDWMPLPRGTVPIADQDLRRSATGRRCELYPYNIKKPPETAVDKSWKYAEGF